MVLVFVIAAMFVSCGTERRMCIFSNQGMTEMASCLNALKD